MKKRIINWDIEMLNSIHDFFYDLDTKEESERKVGDDTKKEAEVKVEEPKNKTEDEKKGGND